MNIFIMTYFSMFTPNLQLQLIHLQKYVLDKMKAFILCVKIIAIYSIVKCSEGGVKREDIVSTWLIDRKPLPSMLEIKEKLPSKIENIESIQEGHDTMIQKLKEDIEHLKAIA